MLILSSSVDKSQPPQPSLVCKMGAQFIPDTSSISCYLITLLPIKKEARGDDGIDWPLLKTPTSTCWLCISSSNKVFSLFSPMASLAAPRQQSIVDCIHVKLCCTGVCTWAYFSGGGGEIGALQQCLLCRMIKLSWRHMQVFQQHLKAEEALYTLLLWYFTKGSVVSFSISSKCTETDT